MPLWYCFWYFYRKLQTYRQVKAGPDIQLPGSNWISNWRGGVNRELLLVRLGDKFNYHHIRSGSYTQRHTNVICVSSSIPNWHHGLEMQKAQAMVSKKEKSCFEFVFSNFPSLTLVLPESYCPTINPWPNINQLVGKMPELEMSYLLVPSTGMVFIINDLPYSPNKSFAN